MGLISRLTRRSGPVPAEQTRPAPEAPDLQPTLGDRLDWNLGRNPVSLPVQPGLPATPVEGVAERDAKLRWHGAGDCAACHTYRTGGATDVGDVDGVIARAAAPGERGLVG